jgi:hypothetical protein
MALAGIRDAQSTRRRRGIVDDREQLQKEPTCHPGLRANDGNCGVKDFWRHQLNRIKDKAEGKQSRDDA